MEVRIESMICVWGDVIPTMLIESINLLIPTVSEEGLRKSIKEFTEKHELGKFFLCGFGLHVASTIPTCINATRVTPKW